MENFLENIRANWGRTLIFALLLLCGLTLFFAFSHDETIRIALLVVVTLSYITWGIIHHHMKHDLTLVIALEYITVAIFAAVGIVAILGWGKQ